MVVCTLADLSGTAACAYFEEDLQQTTEEDRAFRYFRDGSLEPWFIGTGAEALGLRGTPATPEIFGALCQGYGPEGQPLRQNAGIDKDAAWDLTFNFSKSVSVAAVLGDEATRSQIQALGAGAMEEVMQFVEEHVAETRRGKKGHRVEAVEGIVAAAFPHFESRYGDPHFHIHVVVFNTCLRTDRTWGALHSPSLYRAKMALGALGTAELAARLSSLGVPLRSTENGFELRQVTEKLCKALSTGSELVRAKARELGLSSARALEGVNQLLRPTKASLKRSTLVDDWARIARSHGVQDFSLRTGTTQAFNLDHCRRAARRATSWARIVLSREHSTFLRTDVLRRAAQECALGQARLADIRNAVDGALADESRVIAVRSLPKERLFTTRENLATEQKAIQQAEQSKTDRVATVSLATLRRAARQTALDAEQTTALHEVMSNPGAIKVVSGAAGTGKTRLMRAVRIAGELEGVRVMGAAPTGSAAEALATGAGLQRQSTVASLLPRLDQELRQGDVLIVDEAAMVGFRELARIIDSAIKVGAKLILCGDDRQLGPVLAGGSLFTEIGRRVGVAALTKLWRQELHPWMVKLNRHLAAAESEEAIRLLVAEDRIHVARGLESPVANCINDYLELTAAQRSGALVLASTVDQVQYINRRIQGERLSRGELLPYSVLHPGVGCGDDDASALRLHVGERIGLRRNQLLPQVGPSRSGSTAVYNGDFGEVTAIHGARVRVLLDRQDRDEERVEVTLDLREYPHVELGYAATTHRSQGKTVERVYFLAEAGALDAGLAYVAMTRQTEDLNVYAHELDLGVELADFAKALERGRREQAAIEQLQEELRSTYTEEAANRLSLTWGHRL